MNNNRENEKQTLCRFWLWALHIALLVSRLSCVLMFTSVSTKIFSFVVLCTLTEWFFSLFAFFHAFFLAVTLSLISPFDISILIPLLLSSMFACTFFPHKKLIVFGINFGIYRRFFLLLLLLSSISIHWFACSFVGCRIVLATYLLRINKIWHTKWIFYLRSLLLLLLPLPMGA